MLALLLSLAAASPLSDWLASERAPEAYPDTASSYRFSVQLFADIDAALQAHPEAAWVEQYGESLHGRPLWAFHLGPEEADHSTLVFANLHALEWIGSEVATDLLVELIHHPPTDVAVTIVPVANPDGRAKVEQDLLLGRDVYRRGNQDNVDLNRDWAVNREPPAVWRHLIPGYYGHSDTPLSQPETSALDALVAQRRYTRAASLHSFGGYLYYPWSGAWERPADRGDFLTLGRAMEQAQGPRAYRTRQLSRWGFFFRACGSEIDHLYGRYGTRAFLIELTRSGLRPLRLRQDMKTPFRWYNPRQSARHRRRGLDAVRALVFHPTLPSEQRGLRPPPLPFDDG